MIIPDLASERAERVLATAACVGVAASSLLLLAQAVGLPATPVRGQLLALIALAGVEAAAMVLVCLRLGRVDHRVVAVDVVVRCALLLATAGAAHDWAAETAGANSPLYDYVLMTTFLAGVATWRWWQGQLAAGVVAVASAGGELWLGNPAWNVVPNSANFFGLALLGWVLGWLLRGVAGQIDRHRADAVRQAERLAGERERIRYAGVLRERVVGTLEEVLAAGAVGDPRLAAQVRDDTAWLRQFMAGDLAVSGGLREALTGVVEVFGRKGLRVLLDCPREVGLSGERTEALAEAAREALTNVVKHAGVDDAVVRVREHDQGWLVDVVDLGRGFDARARSGVGQALSITTRLDEVGGWARISAKPGEGTTVWLWAPR
ncbi:MAG: hypothetical protein HOV94_10820 [Saccharothrix sp.]|nr:hypothetical protein [Saccharothrix sp.]